MMRASQFSTDPWVRRFYTFTTCALSVALTASPAVARTSATAAAPATEETIPSTDADARRDEGVRLYEDATRLYDAGDYPNAVEGFKASFDLIGESVLLYNIGMCYDRMGQYDQALEYFRRYRAVASASEQVEVDRKIASVQTRRDAGTPAGVDPTDEEATVALGSSPQANQTDADRDANAVGDDTDGRVLSPVVWGLGGAAIVGLGLGLGFGIAAVRRNNAADSSCPEQNGVRLCNESGSTDLQRGRVFGIVSITSLAVGGALAIAAVAVVASRAAARRRGQRSTKRASIQPTFGGMAVRF